MGLGIELWLALIGVALFAGVVKGVVGFAMPMVMISGFGTFVAPDLALGLLIIPTAVANVAQAFRNGLAAAIQSAKVHWRFIAILLVFMFASAQLVTIMSPSTMLLVLGVPIVVFGMAQLLGWRLTIPDNARRRMELIVGSIAGFVGGLSGIWGPPTVTYLTALNTPKVDAMRIQGIIYGIGAVALILAHLQSGVLNGTTAPASALLVAPAVIGTLIGFRIQDRMDQEKFRKATLAVLIIAGLNLLRRGLGF